MSERKPNALLIYPFSDFILKQRERLIWSYEMLNNAQKVLRQKNEANELIESAKWLIKQVTDDLNHLSIEDKGE